MLLICLPLLTKEKSEVLSLVDYDDLPFCVNIETHSTNANTLISVVKKAFTSLLELIDNFEKLCQHNIVSEDILVQILILQWYIIFS